VTVLCRLFRAGIAGVAAAPFCSGVGLTAFQHTSRADERRQFIIETMQRLQRPISIYDLAPRASEYAAYEKAFQALLTDGRIVSDGYGLRRRRFYSLARK